MNPWKEIELNDYESHMKQDDVRQLQTLAEMMKDQFYQNPVTSIMIMGVAGGNGLTHVHSPLQKVYGIDINKTYLDACTKRYPWLKDIFKPICIDLTQDVTLPKAELIIANLFIEYVGYSCFQAAVKQVSPGYVSCIIQVNEADGFVSDSPYLHAFDRLEEVYHEIDEEGCRRMMQDIMYEPIRKNSRKLPNGKYLLQLDYRKK